MNPIPINGDASLKKAIDYMEITPGITLQNKDVDVVFVGRLHKLEIK